MNKELINKYWNEFVHWKDGGNVQVKFMCDSEPKWYTDKESFEETGRDNFTDVLYKEYRPKDRVNSILIIIDDEYVEFRKALAEGKTIQIAGLNPIAHPHAHKNTWEDMQGTVFNKAIELYRIKPEEPKFKVGDWVRDLISGKIHRVNNEDTVNGKFSQVIKWQPKEGELVILKNKNDTISIIKYNGETNVYPFIGEITWLHKKD